MKTMLKKLERLFAAIGLAEEGEQGAALELMGRDDRPSKVRRFGKHRGATTSSPMRPARRAA